jgi:cell division protein FtsI/penicillin-binding protein 2
MHRRYLLRAVLFAAALGLLDAALGSDTNPGSVAATALARADQVAGSATTSAPAVARDPRDGQPVGDAFLRGRISLQTARLERHAGAERYVVDLGGGERAVLTLVPAVQRAAERVLLQARAPLGAVVVMDDDGRILALAGRRNQEPARERDFELPLTVWAPAASIFKLVTAGALLAVGVPPGRRVCYHGGLRGVEPSHLIDDPRRDQQCDDLGVGVARSQNAILAKLAHRHLDAARLRLWAERFGVTRPPDFALAAEPGRVNIPTSPLEFARVAAGFWNTEISVLGGALLAAVVASGGLHVAPRIVDAIVDGRGTTVRVRAPAPRRAIPGRIASVLRDMMVATTESGTAYTAFHDRRGRRFLRDIKVAGKTGSLVRDNPYLSYSWFVGFAPATGAKVSISVLLGNPERWWLKAHTAARLVLETVL